MKKYFAVCSIFAAMMLPVTSATGAETDLKAASRKDFMVFRQYS